jgi:hypothetical protein
MDKYYFIDKIRSIRYKFKICLVCWGKRDMKYDKCWHCIDCDYAECAYTLKENFILYIRYGFIAIKFEIIKLYFWLKRK